METFHPGKLEKPHHYLHHHLHHHHHHHPQPPLEFLPASVGRYGAKSHPGPPSGNAFSSWNDYLGLATLITQAVSQRQEKKKLSPKAKKEKEMMEKEKEEEKGGFGVEEEEEEEDLEEEEEEEDLEEEDLEELEDLEDLEEEEGAHYFGTTLDLRHLDLFHHHHHHHHHHPLKPVEGLLEERFADLSPFSSRERSPPRGWEGRLLGAVEGVRLPALPPPPPPPPPPLPPPPPGRPTSRQLLLKQPDLQVCVFCRNNKEAVALYTTHILKGPDGRVLCPVLRRYTCPLCGASGDNAHTIKYCPLSKMPKAPMALKGARQHHLLGKKAR